MLNKCLLLVNKLLDLSAYSVVLVFLILPICFKITKAMEEEMLLKIRFDAKTNSSLNRGK